jgi:preprotein translocase subunit SecY
MIIFANIVSGIVTNLYSSIIGAESTLTLFLAVFVLIVMLILLSIFIIKTIKEIPVLYTRQGKVQQTLSVPFPLNPV